MKGYSNSYLKDYHMSNIKSMRYMSNRFHCILYKFYSHHHHSIQDCKHIAKKNSKYDKKLFDMLSMFLEWSKFNMCSYKESREKILNQNIQYHKGKINHFDIFLQLKSMLNKMLKYLSMLNRNNDNFDRGQNYFEKFHLCRCIDY
jgi:hypothetical protein